MRVRRLALLALLLGACKVSVYATEPLPPRPPWSPEQLAGAVGYWEVAVSPAGDEAAFATDRSGAYELWTASLSPSLATGRTGPLQQRTHAHQSVSDLQYAPDGSFLVFGMDHGGDAREQLWMLPRGASEPKRITGEAYSEEDAQISPDGKSVACAVDREKKFRFNLEVIDLATGLTRLLTHEREVGVLRPRWSADGKTLAGGASPDGTRGWLVVVDVASGISRKIAPPREDGLLSPEGFLPDGRLVATATNEAGFRQLCLVELVHDTVTWLGPSDWDVELVKVLATGSVLYARNVHGETDLSIADGPEPFASPPRLLEKGGVLESMDADRAGTQALALRQSTGAPTEAIQVDLPRGRVTLAVPAELPGVEIASLARAERRTVPSFDGTPIDAWVWWPPVARMGSPPPLVVYPHGGPDLQSRGGFNPLVQALTEAGFAVTQPNYRGSIGYGRAFRDKNRKDWGGGDLKDLLAVVDDLSAVGKIDGSRVGILGGSYGGYLALRAITATPDRWQAAADMYGMPDLIADYRLTEGASGNWYQSQMGTPETDHELFVERSPIFALDRVKAALLVLQGENDNEVPRLESEALVQGLRERKRRVEYVVYPDEGHGFTHRDHRLDSWKHIVAFFTRELAGRPATP